MMNLNFILKSGGTHKYGRISLIETSDMDTFNALVNSGAIQASNSEQIEAHAEELERQGFVQCYVPEARLVEALATLVLLELPAMPRRFSPRFGRRFTPVARMAKAQAWRIVRRASRDEPERVRIAPNIETYSLGTL